MRVSREADWLIARFSTPQRALSWAIVGGGFCEVRSVAWLEIRNADLPPNVDPRALLHGRMRAQGVGDGVGLLTSRRLDAFVDVTAEIDDVRARCVATVGLGNALRAGDPLCDVRPVGTINVLCHVSQPLTDGAMLEGLALMSEAKALAVREGAVPSIASAGLASGTGTDCLVLVCPLPGTSSDASLGVPRPFAGKHTDVGHVIGAAVHDAVARGVRDYERVLS